jgi:glycosyltransferase involved in cell wall biosynthesis
VIDRARVPRIAFFTDSYNEANGVARLTRAFEAVARRRNWPWLTVHGDKATRLTDDGSTMRLELRRGAAAFRLEHDLAFDVLLWRHYRRVAALLRDFRADIVHFTGPSDVGQLGALLGHRLSIPMVGSWHTNLHQYAAMRSARYFRWMPASVRQRVFGAIRQGALRATTFFYEIPRVVLAPNPELVALLAQRTGKPAYLMKHGVDTEMFSPRPRNDDGTVRIGFVGRLAAEKQVHMLPKLAEALRGTGERQWKFVIVGDGAERESLQHAIPEAEFRGVLTGETLAQTYASLDLFVFPSRSETFGLVVLEAMASGVPVLAMADGGPRYSVEDGVSGVLARDDDDFVEAGVHLVRNRDLRRRLASGARAAALRWSWDTVANDLYDVYADVARLRSAGFPNQLTA